MSWWTNIVRELLLNVVKHAKTDKAVIELSEDSGVARIAIHDSGAGFIVEERLDGLTADGGVVGLASARERLALFGGRLEIESQPGVGTRVTVIVPLQSQRGQLQDRPSPEAL